MQTRINGTLLPSYPNKLVLNTMIYNIVDVSENMKKTIIVMLELIRNFLLMLTICGQKLKERIQQ